MHLGLNQVHGLILGLVFQVGGFGLSGTRVMSSNWTRVTDQILDPLHTPVCFASIAWQLLERQVLGQSLLAPSSSPIFLEKHPLKMRLWLLSALLRGASGTSPP